MTEDTGNERRENVLDGPVSFTSFLAQWGQLRMLELPSSHCAKGVGTILLGRSMRGSSEGVLREAQNNALAQSYQYRETEGAHYPFLLSMKD